MTLTVTQMVAESISKLSIGVHLLSSDWDWVTERPQGLWISSDAEGLKDGTSVCIHYTSVCVCEVV